MAPAVSPPHARQHYRRSSDSSDSECSCNSRLNTPWSHPVSSASGPLVSHRGRRASTSERGARSRSKIRTPSVGRPLIHQDKSPRSVSPYRYQKELIVPARSRRSAGDANYITYASPADLHGSRSSRYRSYDQGHGLPRVGRTKFPKKLVIRDAVEEKGYPFTIEENGAIVVLQVLGRPEIEELVELSEEIRRRSYSGKAVSFHEKTVVHDFEPLPEAPAPPETRYSPVSSYSLTSPRGYTTDVNMSTYGGNEIVVVPPPSAPVPITYPPHQYPSQDLTVIRNSPPRYEPLGPPGPAAPVPGTVKSIEISTPFRSATRKSEEKVRKAEGKAVRAEMKAIRKEERARTTGRASDEYDAWKARENADSLMRKVERVEAKTMKKKEKVFGVRVARNAKGEILILEN